MSLIPLIKFCREHGTPKLRAAKPLALTQYLAWAAAQNYVITLQDGEDIAGVAIAWSVKDLGSNPKAYCRPWDPMRAQDPSSGVLYIANWAAPDGDGVRRMIEAASERWPNVERFLGHRTRRDGREVLVQYPLKSAGRLYQLTQRLHES